MTKIHVVGCCHLVAGSAGLHPVSLLNFIEIVLLFITFSYPFLIVPVIAYMPSPACKEIIKRRNVKQELIERNGEG